LPHLIIEQLSWNTKSALTFELGVRSKSSAGYQRMLIITLCAHKYS